MMNLSRTREMIPFLRRSISGAIYALIIAVGLLGPQPLFLIVFGFALLWALHEFFSMSLKNELRESRFWICMAVVFLFVVLYLTRLGLCSVRWSTLSFVPFFIGIVWPIWTSEKNEYANMGYITAGLLFVALPLLMTPLLVVRGGVYDGMFLLCVFIIVALNDVGAYLLGSTLGQRKGAKRLAPKISPKKSWWGVVGGCIVSIAISAVLSRIGWIGLDLGHSMALGLVLSVVGVLGDLVESMWKRCFSVKDSGSLIPGHGGLYDRLDSVLWAIPSAVVYLELFGLLQ